MFGVKRDVESFTKCSFSVYICRISLDVIKEIIHQNRNKNGSKEITFKLTKFREEIQYIFYLGLNADGVGLQYYMISSDLNEAWHP